MSTIQQSTVNESIHISSEKMITQTDNRMNSRINHPSFIQIIQEIMNDSSFDINILIEQILNKNVKINTKTMMNKPNNENDIIPPLISTQLSKFFRSNSCYMSLYVFDSSQSDLKSIQELSQLWTSIFLCYVPFHLKQHSNPFKFIKGFATFIYSYLKFPPFQHIDWVVFPSIINAINDSFELYSNSMNYHQFYDLLIILIMIILIQKYSYDSLLSLLESKTHQKLVSDIIRGLDSSMYNEVHNPNCSKNEIKHNNELKD